MTIQNQLQVLETRRTRIQLAEKLAAAQLAQAVVNVERTSVKSPIDGVIVAESVEEDSYVAKGATLCVIEDTQRVEVSCNLRTDQLLLVLDQNSGNGKEGSSVVQSSSYELPKTAVTVSYRVPGRDDVEYAWKGHLSRYEGIGLDSKSRTVPVRVTVENPREVYRNGEKIDEESNGGLPALVNGMFVDLAIHTQPSRSFVLLPKLALLPGNQVLTFQIDSELIRDESANEQSKQNDAPSDLGEEPVATKKLPSKSEDLGIDVADWEPGRIQVVNGVKVIRTVRPSAQTVKSTGSLNQIPRSRRAGSLSYLPWRRSSAMVRTQLDSRRPPRRIEIRQQKVSKDGRPNNAECNSLGGKESRRGQCSQGDRLGRRPLLLLFHAERDLPRVSVGGDFDRCSLPGATPDEVESGISQKVEEAIQSISGINKLTSICREGAGYTLVQLDPNVKDVQKILSEIRSAVDRVSVFFPERSEKATVEQITFRLPAIRVAVIGPDDRSSAAETGFEITPKLFANDCLNCLPSPKPICRTSSLIKSTSRSMKTHCAVTA